MPPINQAPELVAICTPPKPARAIDQDAGHAPRTFKAPAIWLLLLLPFSYLWLSLLSNLWFEWTTNPQYAYGFVVVFLSAGMFVRNGYSLRKQAPQKGDKNPQPDPRSPWSFGVLSVVGLFVLLALLYLPTRLIGEAIPEWRPIQWALGIVTIGLTLCAIYVGRGLDGLK